MRTWRSCAGLAAIIGTAALGASSATAQAALVVTNVIDLPPGTNPGRIAVDESNGSGAFGLAIDHRRVATGCS